MVINELDRTLAGNAGSDAWKAADEESKIKRVSLNSMM
jgi:hypothetical protein